MYCSGSEIEKAAVKTVSARVDPGFFHLKRASGTNVCGAAKTRFQIYFAPVVPGASAAHHLSPSWTKGPARQILKKTIRYSTRFWLCSPTLDANMGHLLLYGCNEATRFSSVRLLLRSSRQIDINTTVVMNRIKSDWVQAQLPDGWLYNCHWNNLFLKRQSYVTTILAVVFTMIERLALF